MMGEYYTPSGETPGLAQVIAHDAQTKVLLIYLKPTVVVFFCLFELFNLEGSTLFMESVYVYAKIVIIYCIYNGFIIQSLDTNKRIT